MSFQIQDPPYIGPNGPPMSWWGFWESGHLYPRGAVVRDGDWLMVATKPTEERAGPVKIGSPFFLYDGANPTEQTTAKILEYAVEYTFPRGGFVISYRLYTITGNTYRIFTISETGQVTEILLFTANNTAWQEFDLKDTPVVAGTIFTIFVQVREPDPTPTTIVGEWNYSTPNNEGIPAAGQSVHASRLPESLRISSIDDNAGDRYAELATLTIGDIIESQGTRWAIQNISDNTTWFDFTVAPAAQAPSDGVQQFIFETVTATPITFLKDVGFWLSNENIRGYEQIDGAGGAYNENAYGIDIQVQDASVPEDWDFLAYGGV